MSYSAKDFFSDWYSAIDPKVDANIAAARIKAIKKIIQKDKKQKEFWMDVVRISLGIKPNDNANIEALVAEFRGADDNFPLTGNEHLIKTLSAITLLFKLETEDAYIKAMNSLAIKNLCFFDITECDTRIPVVEKSYEYLRDYNNYGRKVSLLKAEENIKAYDDYIKKPVPTDGTEEKHVSIALLVRPILVSHRALSEETNALWWVFSQYSKLFEKDFGAVGVGGMIFVGANELASLTEFQLGFSAAKPLLSKALELSASDSKMPKKVSPFDIINSIEEADKIKLLPPDKTLTELTPCLRAMKISMDFPEGDDWSGSYKKTTGIDLKKKVSIIDLTFQIYNEYILLKSL